MREWIENQRCKFITETARQFIAEELLALNHDSKIHLRGILDTALTKSSMDDKLVAFLTHRITFEKMVPSA